MEKVQHYWSVFFTNLVMVVLFSTSLFASPQSWKKEGWRNTDFSRHSIRWSEILSGGPPKDGIPSIDDPKFAPVSAIKNISPTEAVIGVQVGEEARAYPLRILIWHEIVNDKIGDVPIAATYCPLCNAAIVFDRRLGGKTLSFGTTGKLRNSDLVMYDRQTESWWQQFTGEAIVGELTGQKLKILPARLESFALFKKRHPNGLVLVVEDQRFRDYGRNPYVNYDSSVRPFLFSGELPKNINPMARIVVVRSGDDRYAVALTLLRKKGPITFNDIELSWRKGQASALDANTVRGGRDVGNVIVRRQLAEGQYEDVPYDVTFAFVFHAFHPKETIVQRCPQTEKSAGGEPRQGTTLAGTVTCALTRNH